MKSLMPKIHGIDRAMPQHWSHFLSAVTKMQPHKIVNDEHWAPPGTQISHDWINFEKDKVYNARNVSVYINTPV
jgi:hypothetical protein